ncbi:CBS domain-containing protein [Deltaproteobacteria bacterium TL4]
MAKNVSDYMTKKVVSIQQNVGIRDAFFIMKNKSIRHLPIVENGKLIGIISDRELRRPNWVDESQDITHVYYLDNTMTVSDIMVTKVHVLHTQDTLHTAVRLLLDRHIGAAPVLDENENLVGILSMVDLLRAMAEMIELQPGKNK